MGDFCKKFIANYELGQYVTEMARDSSQKSKKNRF